MNYRDRLMQRWAVARLTSEAQWAIVARFRTQSDAEGHLRFLQRSMPETRFKLLFDLPADMPSREQQ